MYPKRLKDLNEKFKTKRIRRKKNECLYGEVNK